MIFNSAINGHSLAEEVRLAEQHLQVQKSIVQKDLSTLDLAVRQRVTAPDALLWSVGTGFVLGELTKKRGDKKAKARAKRENAELEEQAQHDADRAEREQDADRPSVIQMMLHYWAVARPIVATATTILAPYLQAKAAHAGASVAVHEAMHQAGETSPAQAPVSPNT